MGIILTSTGLPLLTSTGAIASGAPVSSVVPEPKPEPDLQPDPGKVTLRGPATSISYRGVTFKFSSPVKWYDSANGDPVVITDATNLSSGTTLVEISPASALVGGYQAHGAMLNPIPGVPGAQGFDAGMELTPPAGSIAVFDYDPNLNVDPGRTRTAFSVPRGFKGTIVKSVRASGASPSGTKMIEKYVPLTFMDAPPPGAGTWFRPAASLPGASMAWRYRVEDINWGALRDLAPPPGLSSAATYHAEISSQNTHHIPIWATTWDPGRRFQLVGETPSNGYPRDYGRRRGEYACSLHVNPGADQTARRALAAILTQWGIDLDGAHQLGERHGTGAGQWYGYIEFFYLAAFLLRDAAMLARAQLHYANSIGQCFWVSDRETGFPCWWDWGNTASSFKYAGETYQRTDLGVPEWTHTGWELVGGSAPDSLNRQLFRMNAHIYGHYRDTFFTTQIYELISIGLLRNGPGGETGDAAIRGGAYGTGNIRSAAIAYMDRSVTFDPWLRDGQSGHDGASVMLYNAWRDTIPQARWTGRPDIPQSPHRPEFSAGTRSGEVRFDFLSRNYSTEKVTDMEVAVSQDYATDPATGFEVPFQFIDNSQIAGTDPGSTATGTLTGLRPGKTYCRWRQRSASGWSRWSPTWPLQLPSGSNNHANATLYKAPRGRVTVPGTASGALTNRVPPAVLHKPYSAHDMPYFEPVTDARHVMTFYAGIGYWDGGTGALSAAYQWQRNGANISGATGKSYTRTTADNGTSLRCRVTVNGTAVNSNAVSIPAMPSWPSTTIIDMDFTGASPFEWPTLWSSIVGAIANATPRHLHDVKLETTVSRGLLHIQKTAGNPGINNALITSAAPAGNYTWEAEIGCGYFPASSADALGGNVLFRLRNTANAVWGNATYDFKPSQAPGMVAIKGTFTVPPSGDRSIRLFLQAAVSTGGASNALGGPIISKLRILKVS